MSKEEKLTQQYIITKWMGILLVIYIPIIVLILFGPNIGSWFIKGNLYDKFMDKLVFNVVSTLGILLLLAGFAIEEISYFIKKKRYAALAGCMAAVIVCILGIYLSSQTGYINDRVICYVKDLPYAVSQTYCEKDEKVTSITKKVVIGKTSQTYVYLETETLKFQFLNNLPDGLGYDEFRNKYSSRIAKVKYLPNTNLLLSIESVEV